MFYAAACKYRSLLHIKEDPRQKRARYITGTTSLAVVYKHVAGDDRELEVDG